MGGLALSINQLLISEPVILNYIEINANASAGRIVFYLNKHGPANMDEIMAATRLKLTTCNKKYLDQIHPDIILFDYKLNKFKINPKLNIKFFRISNYGR